MRKDGFDSLLAGAAALALVSASISAARAAPVFQTSPGAYNAFVQLAGCWWVQGPWGPQQVCRDEGHHDYHPGHFDEHNGHLDYHPGHMDYHHNGHVDHEDDE